MFPLPSPFFPLLSSSVTCTEFWEQNSAVGEFGRKALMTYPRIAECNPVFHTVTKLLKTQICIIIKIINHAYVLPATILFLENLWK